MIVEAMIRECDYTGKRFAEPVLGYHFFAQGATGRVCCVLAASKEAFDVQPKAITLDELEKLVEEKGGYLDY
ncbi:hypothetical protein [Synechococcus phage BUCT-ZZ01]|nr:hypothetical protein [Synechococcus phage BUCT-ZZ01]